MLNPGFWKAKIFNSGFGKAKTLELAKILKAAKILNSEFEKLKC